MKIIQANNRLKTLADNIPIDILADKADVQTSEDTPSKVEASRMAFLASHGKNCVVFDFDEHHLYFLGTIREVEAKLKTLKG